MPVFLTHPCPRWILTFSRYTRTWLVLNSVRSITGSRSSWTKKAKMLLCWGWSSCAPYPALWIRCTVDETVGYCCMELPPWCAPRYHGPETFPLPAQQIKYSLAPAETEYWFKHSDAVKIHSFWLAIIAVSYDWVCFPNRAPAQHLKQWPRIWTVKMLQGVVRSAEGKKKQHYFCMSCAQTKLLESCQHSVIIKVPMTSLKKKIHAVFFLNPTHCSPLCCPWARYEKRMLYTENVQMTVARSGWFQP